MRFGDYIRKLREAKGLTLTQAARELGITPQKLCDMEQGRRAFKRPPLQLMFKLSAAYDHPYESLMENSEFFRYEREVFSDLLGDIAPLTRRLEVITLRMIEEARKYTPEMEGAAKEAFGVSQNLKAAITAAKLRFSRGQALPEMSGEPTHDSSKKG